MQNSSNVQNTANNSSTEVRFVFLHDPEDGRRHATVARRISGNNVVVSFAVNRVEKTFNNQINYSRSCRSLAPYKSDKFSKQLGRAIAEGRLNNDRFASLVTEIRDGETALTASVRLLSEVQNTEGRSVPHVLRRMARSWLDTRKQG